MTKIDLTENQKHLSHNRPACYVDEKVSADNVFETVIDALQYRSKIQSTAIFITYIDESFNSRSLSYSEFLIAVDCIASLLIEKEGIKPGDRVGISGTASLEVIICYFSVLRLGGILVPIDPRLKLQQEVFILESTSCSLWIYDDNRKGPLPNVDIKAIPIKMLDYNYHSKKLCPLDNVKLETNHPAVILSTSGTTSEPKLPCISHRNLMANVKGLKELHNADREMVSMCVLPIFHANAFGFSLTGTIYWGGKLVISNGLLGLSTSSIAKEYKVNVISLVPSLIRVLLAQEFMAEKIPTLRYVVSAAAPLSQKLAKEFYTHTGIRIHQGWGLTECTNFATMIPCQIDNIEYEKAMHDDDFPSIGTSTLDCSVDIVDPHSGSLLDEGKVGELVVRGSNIMLGYWGRADFTEDAIGGMSLLTGDLGYWRTIANLKMFFICGRIKEIIIRSGENVSPMAVENELEPLLLKYPLAVVGFENKYVGEEIGLYIQADNSPSIKREIEKVISEVSETQRPRFVILGDVDIPRTSTGKIQRRKVSSFFCSQWNKIYNNNKSIFIDFSDRHYD